MNTGTVITVLALALLVAVLAITWLWAKTVGVKRSEDPLSPELATRTDLAATQSQIQSSLDSVKEAVSKHLVTLATQQGQTNTHLTDIAESNKGLSSTTSQLQKLLDSKTDRGAWGERMAEDVIRSVGLQEGVNFRKQTMTTNGKRPDFTFLLPESRVLHMDVKFPLDNYRRHIEGDQDLEKFNKDVRARIMELVKSNYAQATNSVGFVLMFLPVDSLFTAILQQKDNKIVALAENNNVVLCSPTTLFPILSLIRTAMDTFHMMAQGQEIVKAVVAFEQEWRTYNDHVDKVYKQLNTFTNSFDDLVGSKRRVLQRKVDSVVDLRDNTATPLPGQEDISIQDPSRAQVVNAA